MISLLLIFLIGLAIAYFATQNQIPVTLKLSDTVWTSVPLYIIAVGSLLLGVFMSWIIHVFDMFSSSIAIHGKNSTIRASKSEITKLEKRIQELEAENATMRETTSEEVVRDEKVTEESKPRFSILHPFRQRFT